MLTANLPRIDRFKGINNVTDPLRLGMEWLAQADNVNVTDTGALEKRAGYSLHTSGAYTGAYSTLDFTRMYVTVGGALKDFVGNTLKILTSSAPMNWTEINAQVFFNNGTDSGIIQTDNTVLDWGWAPPGAVALSAVTGSLPAGTYQACSTMVLPDGRETGTSGVTEITLTEGQALQISGIAHGANVYIAPANSEVFQLAYTRAPGAVVWNSTPDALGRDLTNAFLDPLPYGTSVIQAWRGRIYAAQYMATEDQTVVWFSEPLGFHLFNLNSNFFMVPGKVTMLAPHSAALIVGTDARIYAYGGDKLDQLAEYGVVPGQHWSLDETRLLFWSTRGLCAALPFANLTEKQVSVAPGVRAGGCLVRSGGQKRFLAVLQQGGSPFNSL